MTTVLIGVTLGSSGKGAAWVLLRHLSSARCPEKHLQRGRNISAIFATAPAVDEPLQESSGVVERRTWTNVHFKISVGL